MIHNLKTPFVLCLGVLGLTMTLSGCGGMSAKHKNSVLPPSEASFAQPDATLVWVGRGLSYRHTTSGWVRAPSADYDFTVVQRRYASQWQSVKTLHRRHPDYDGTAGPRDQNYYFELRYTAPSGNVTPFTVTSSLGVGQGTTDPDFREQRFELVPKRTGRFAPFNLFRLTQTYRYESGTLVETVELLRRSEASVETPFVKIEEEAQLFSPTTLTTAPTAALN